MDLSDLYTEVITEYGRSQKHRHPLEHPDVTERGVNPSCGDDISLELEVNGGVIEKAAILGSGCAISQASAAIMAGLIEGKPTGEANRLAALFLGMIRKDVTDENELEELQDGVALQNISNMPARVKCATLPWHTLEEALKKL
ncbi:nitrogen fixation protein NifU [Sporobacter termitidis DSM 10068]|uniref:Nitrogen fixation protein NifU n=1 Tax=Sporobacter termitidis DSM 10068 TaxID=1123282 RepID=A0A1M5WJ09_9FIRM|nr:SUF system NifU family Fe-S cluster assembly protein [Sporobacter termitidis]SHH87472.1 nitrogen fixation protein NifU [Sporobacter termitidis DSM 10068]